MCKDVIWINYLVFKTMKLVHIWIEFYGYSDEGMREIDK